MNLVVESPWRHFRWEQEWLVTLMSMLFQPQCCSYMMAKLFNETEMTGEEVKIRKTSAGGRRVARFPAPLRPDPPRGVVSPLREDRARGPALEVTSARGRWAGLCPTACWVVSNTFWSAPAGPAASLSPPALAASDSSAPDRFQRGTRF